MLFSQTELSDQFWWGHHEEHFCKINLNQEEMWFKDISYLEVWKSIFLRSKTVGRGHREAQFCEIIFEFGPVVQEMLF